MLADHNYMSFPQGERSLAQVLSFLSGVTVSNFETSNDYDNDDAIISVSTSSVQQSSKDSNYSCDQCNLRVHGSSEELRKHYFHIALKICFCRNCGCIYRNEECLNEHMNQVHVRKEAAQNFSSIHEEAGKQTAKRVIPVLFMVKELINSNNKDQEDSESTDDELENAAVLQSEVETPIKIPFNDDENASKEGLEKAKKPLSPIQESKRHLRLRKKLPVTRFPCLKCGKTFATRDLLRRHITGVHMKIYECEECEERPTFKTLGDRLKHMRAAHKTRKQNPDAKSTLCETCGKLFKSPSVLKGHQTVHANPNADYMCSQCGKMFRNRRLLKVHEATHTPEKPFVCHICGKGLKRKDCLVLHLNRHFKVRKLSCHVCGRHFDTKGNLTRHLMIHTGERPFACDVCGMRFRQKLGLQTHMQHHNDVHKYVCDICGKKSRLKCVHEKHMLSHSERGENFKSKGNYRKHELYNSNDGPKYRNSDIPPEDRHKCDQCGRRLANNTLLRLHKAVHSTERNYKCDECDKTFKTDNSLYLHKKTHLAKISPIRYHCKMCNKRFRAVRYVRTHIKYFHPEALKDNPKGNALYEVVSDEQRSVPNKPSTSSYNSVCEQENTMERLQGIYMGIPETTMDNTQQPSEYYVL